MSKIGTEKKMSMYDEIKSISEITPFSVSDVKKVYLSTGSKKETIDILNTSLSTGIHYSNICKAVNAEMYRDNMKQLFKEIESRRLYNRIKNAVLSELRRTSAWDDGWRIVLLAGLITLAGTMLILMMGEVI